LALAYAEEHPERVSALILSAVTMTRPAEIDWLYHGAGRFYPEEWQRFRNGVPTEERDGDLVAAYCRLIERGDSQAAQRSCEWEETVAGLGTQARYEDPSFRMAFARIVTHYFSNRAWLEEDALLRRADRLRGIPGVLVHGRLDIGSPLVSAWELAQQWLDADLLVVDNDGHSGDTITARVLDATDRFRRTL
jgi:proline iminopeptidase